MNITIPHEANTSELIMKLGGAVHGVGGPPATLTCGDLVVGINDLGLIGAAVAAAGERTSDWTVSSDYTPAPAEVPLAEAVEKVRKRITPVMEERVRGVLHEMGADDVRGKVK